MHAIRCIGSNLAYKLAFGNSSKEFEKMMEWIDLVITEVED